MIILPAIDLKDGRCVRLRQGKADDITVYNDDPVAQALAWREQGAEQLHVVDLDGAFQGEPQHTAVIEHIVRAIGIPVEVGGGLRSDAHVEQILSAGAARAIIGTRALESVEALAALVRRFGDAIAVGIDARDGFVQVKGWVETTGTRATTLAQQVGDAGVRTIIYTDTATDGMLGGPNLTAMREICQAVPACSVIASGGVSAPEHVVALKALGCANLFGAIVGKALYDGKTTLAAMRAAAV
ncbi:MAG TPA: 1-(5-phosphoribosyl)-5-[(5-phosphoribosylamino)methylideneamino]imidazole-4-carboxamide isomerase [Kiritimatiellia bacterium]|mgnify:FL=1|nr:1-(5-phosphoribosyl)-5-[(5-phosphoribosylamino)methylideneamino]imidazole-4-carboxamide isomerase [Kiritimatiellia bacterium]HRU71185.1 1-(5-phosphoribosyl)-5-[(5-phosphoribosylamino)methylideneamino]imidazole-4-carboxamide isomerase [Kiritimatiellia bacterium]